MACVLLAACADDGETVSPYDRAPVPPVPDRTAAVTTDGPLADGSYWAVSVEVGTGAGTVDLTVAQAFFADACTEQFGAEGCDGDVGVLDRPTRTLTVSAASLLEITVVDGERRNYAVPADEWVTLVGGGSPSVDAPEGFAYLPYPYLVVVVDGEVTVVRQVWLP